MAFPSTAIGMAVVFRRPITLVVSRRFDPFVREDARIFSAELGLDLIDADQRLGSWVVPAVPEETYAAFESRYVRLPGTPPSCRSGRSSPGLSLAPLRTPDEGKETLPSPLSHLTVVEGSIDHLTMRLPP